MNNTDNAQAARNADQAESAPAANPPASQADAAGNDANQPITLEEARRLRSEAKNLRDRLKQAEDGLKTYKDKELTEAQKLQNDLKEREEQAAAAEQRARNLSVQLQATRLGIVDPDAAAKLIDWSKVDGSDESASAALKDLLKARPWLGQPQAGVTTAAGNPARQGAALTLEEIRQMSQAEVLARYDEVMAALKG